MTPSSAAALAGVGVLLALSVIVLTVIPLIRLVDAAGQSPLDQPAPGGNF
jgi:hypothetical protein